LKPLPYDPSSPVQDQFLASFQVSLGNLRTTYLDSYILQSLLGTLGGMVEAWKTFMYLQDQGQVNYLRQQYV